MGMDATATLAYCVELEEGDESVERFDGDIEDWWVCEQAGVESLWEDGITKEQRDLWRAEYPCPLCIEYTGSYDYAVPVIYWKGSRHHCWWGETLELSPNDLVFQISDHNEFIEWLKKLGYEDLVPSWKMFAFYG